MGSSSTCSGRRKLPRSAPHVAAKQWPLRPPMHFVPTSVTPAAAAAATTRGAWKRPVGGAPRVAAAETSKCCSWQSPRGCLFPEVSGRRLGLENSRRGAPQRCPTGHLRAVCRPTLEDATPGILQLQSTRTAAQVPRRAPLRFLWPPRGERLVPGNPIVPSLPPKQKPPTSAVGSARDVHPTDSLAGGGRPRRSSRAARSRRRWRSGAPLQSVMRPTGSCRCDGALLTLFVVKDHGGFDQSGSLEKTQHTTHRWAIVTKDGRHRFLRMARTWSSRRPTKRGRDPDRLTVESQMRIPVLAPASPLADQPAAVQVAQAAASGVHKRRAVPTAACGCRASARRPWNGVASQPTRNGAPWSALIFLITMRLW